MMIIRERTSADLDGCVEVLKLVYKASGYPIKGIDDAETFLTNPNIMKAWVAEHKGQIVGHIGVAAALPENNDVAIWRKLGHREPVACLERLFVDPRQQGTGVAPKLVSTATEYGATHDMRLVLYTLLKDAPARRLYERLGWKHYGDFQFQYGQGQEMRAFCYVSPELHANVTLT